MDTNNQSYEFRDMIKSSAKTDPIKEHQTTGPGIVNKATYGCSLGPYLWSIVRLI